MTIWPPSLLRCTLQRWHPYIISSWFAAYSAIYISFPSLSPCGHFHGYFHSQLSQANVQWSFCLLFSIWKSSNQSHFNLKSKVKMSIFLFGLPCWSLSISKCRHSQCWCSQNTKGYTSMLWLENWQTWYFMCIWSWQYTSFMYLLYSWIFCGWFTWITLWPNLLSVWAAFLGLEFVLTSLTILLSCQTVATKFELPSWYEF